jgi:hypothetical protein
MTFLFSSRTASLTADPYARALDEWRRAARLAADLWQTYLGASREGRALAFGAYAAALDAEEAAADQLARVRVAKAA